MNKIDRNTVAKPECLIENADKWTKDWKKRHKKGEDFYWHEYENQKVNHILNEALAELTASHCSYCDKYPLKLGVIERTIDHFKPKSKYLNLAFAWDNLFLACSQCQKYKRDLFPDDVEPLKPDEADYDFDYWFEIEWKSSKIQPNPIRSTKEQAKAQTTINFLGLNNDDRPGAREEELLKFQDSKNRHLDIYSYRFFLERGVD